MEHNKTSNPAGQWLDRATAGIRFGPDRKEVRAELEAHLEDKALDFQRIFPGLTEAEARERAVSEMGDPMEIGKELAKVHKPWLGYIWRVSQVLLGLVLLSFLAEVGTLAPHAGIRSDREAESAWVVEAAFAGQEPVRINNYTLWVEEAALIQGMGELPGNRLYQHLGPDLGWGTYAPLCRFRAIYRRSGVEWGTDRLWRAPGGTVDSNQH